MEALIVFRRELIVEQKVTVLRVTELYGRREALVKIIKATILNREKTQDIAWVDWSCPFAGIGEVLLGLGFVTLQNLASTVVPLLCNPIDLHKTEYTFLFWSKEKDFYEQLPSFDNWYITKGDGDADRPNFLGW